MADIFLSYAKEDRETAKLLARILEAAGWTVCWDIDVVPGSDWQSVHQAAQREARCTVVLWSGHSAASQRVNEEIQAGRGRRQLIPVLIEPVEPPAHLRAIQFADLTQWDRSPGDPGVRQLIAGLQSMLGESIPPAASAPPRPAPSSGLPPASPGGIGVVVDAVKGVIKLLRPLRFKKSPASTGAESPVDATAIVEPVLLGVAAPRAIAAGSHFTARFAAYVAAAKPAAQEHLQSLGDADDRMVLDIPPDRAARWRVGAPVSVRLTGEHTTITPAERQFEWNGRENLAAFAVAVDNAAPASGIQLCFHVFLGPVQIAFVPLSVAIGATPEDSPAPRLEVRAPASAFASYSSKDAQAVARSLSTLTRWAPTLDIFQDCLDLKTEPTPFKDQLAKEIAAREVFLLFWSRHASASEWVRWEFERAKEKPGLNAILPMPLEDPAIVPPPPGFDDKHLRDRFMIAAYGLQKIAETVRGAE